MNEDLSNIQYSPIKNYDFSRWFETVNYNERTLTDKERTECIDVIDETVEFYSLGLQLTQNSIDSCKGLDDEYHKREYLVSSVTLFVYLTILDTMVVSKYFLSATREYDKRFMRGKMAVILNEGFKQLYGFEKNTRKNSEWARLQPLMHALPQMIQDQYKDLTEKLESHAQSSPWWRDERNYETHIDAEHLYESRKKEIIESKVMMDSLKLFNTLYAISLFLTNVHGYYCNQLIEMYMRGELKAE